MDERQLAAELKKKFGVDFDVEDDYAYYLVEWTGGPSLARVFRYLIPRAMLESPDKSLRFPYYLTRN